MNYKLYDIISVPGIATPKDEPFFLIIGIYGERAWVDYCNIWGEIVSLSPGMIWVLNSLKGVEIIARIYGDEKSLRYQKWKGELE